MPVPWHDGHVLATWNPLSRTNVRVPDPPHEEQVDRFAPAFNPLPEHVPHFTTGVMSIVREVPLQASMNEIPIDA